MGKLMKLELRRTDIRPYLLGALGIFLAVSVLNALMAALPTMTAAAGESLEEDDLVLFSRWEYLLSLSGVLNMACFGVLGGVIGARLVVSEYRGKRAILLLSYPVSRKKVLLAKCVLTFALSAGLALGSELLLGLGLAAAAEATHFIAQGFQPGLLLALAIPFSLMAGAVGLAALVPGMARGSVSGCIVSAVVADCLVCQFVSACQGAGLWLWAAGLLLLAAGSVLWLMGRVERQEAV